MTPAELARIRDLAAGLRAQDPAFCGWLGVGSTAVLVSAATRDAVCEALTALAQEVEAQQAAIEDATARVTRLVERLGGPL